MLVLEMFRADAVALSQLDSLTRVVEKLPKTFKPLVSPARVFQAEILGVPATALSPAGAPTAGVTSAFRERAAITYSELLVRETTVIGIVGKAAARRLRRLPTGQIERLDADTFELTVFALAPAAGCAPLRQVVKRISNALEIEMNPFRYSSESFNELVNEGMVPPVKPTKEQRAASQLLADGDVRSLAIAIKASGGLLLSETPKQLKEAATDENIAALQAAGLVGTEIVVICTRTSGQVARAATREHLSKSAADGVTCACGRALTDERIEEALTITPIGRELLDGSKWMSTLLLESLLSLGVPLDRILIEQQLAGDEMDCFADISGELAFFELKDKEFSLGNAYSFGAKISVFSPDAPVIVTTEHVGNDAKEHFQRASIGGRRRPGQPPLAEDSPLAAIRYIEGIHELRPGLEALASEIYRNDGATLLEDVLSRTAIDPVTLLKALQSH